MSSGRGGQPARWVDRVGCWLIDSAIPATLLVIALALPETYKTRLKYEDGIQWSNTTSDGPHSAFYILIALAIAFILWNKGYREGRTGKSIGKSLFGFTTVSISTDKPLGVWRATARCALLAGDFVICYIGVLWPLWDDKRQCLVSDKVTGSIVVADR